MSRTQMVKYLKKYKTYIALVVLYVLSNVLQAAFLRSCSSLSPERTVLPAQVTVIQRDTTVTLPQTVIVREKLIPRIEIENHYITDSATIKQLLLQKDSLQKELQNKGVTSTVTLDTIVKPTNDTIRAHYEEIHRTLAITYKPAPRTIQVRDVIITQTTNPHWGLGVTTGIGAGYGITGINAGAYITIGLQYHLLNF